MFVWSLWRVYHCIPNEHNIADFSITICQLSCFQLGTPIYIGELWPMYFDRTFVNIHVACNGVSLCDFSQYISSGVNILASSIGICWNLLVFLKWQLNEISVHKPTIVIMSHAGLTDNLENFMKHHDYVNRYGPQTGSNSTVCAKNTSTTQQWITSVIIKNIFIHNILVQIVHLTCLS